MKKFRIGLIIASTVLIIGQLTIVIDYSNLSWSNNTGSYLGIISMICIIISMVLSNRHQRKANKE